MEHLTESGQRRLVAHGVRGRILEGFEPALREVFGGDAVAAISKRLPAAVRATTLVRSAPHWVPVTHMIAFCAAVDEDFARGDAKLLRAWTARSIDHGFGVARRVLLAIATPAVIVRRSSELWHDEFSSGRIVAYGTQPDEAVITLHDHAYTESARMRVVVAEAMRRTLELAGAKDAAAAYDPEPSRTLAVNLCWR